MNKLTNLLLAGSLGITSACAPTLQRDFPDWHVRGYEFQDRTEKGEPYKLERAVILGEQFYTQRVSPREGELGFIFLPFNETKRVINTGTGDVRLESDKNYIPRRVRVEDYTEDEFADEVDLMVDRSPQGIEGVRADILPIEELRRIAQASPGSHGYSVVTTEEDARYGIRTMKILGKEYFFPHVETDETGNPRKLDFYLVPVEGSEIIIRNSDGRITLKNTNNIYRAVLLQKNGEEIEGSVSQTERIRGD